VLTALGTKDFKIAIQDYIKRYNELLAASTYFKKGVFEYYNATQIAKTLADNGFSMLSIQSRCMRMRTQKSLRNGSSRI